MELSTVIPQGYKRTDFGIIPEEWGLTTIGEISTVSSGGTPSRKNTALWGGSIPWITTAQIDFNMIVEANEFITQEGLENSAAKL
ncbi:hypothetical protein [Chitinilyticum litopenaei]|uniref:hypothetical protein n=1 Tax=Chitinilyticum litopenaei TaxID=1121276 RepID=UPI0011868FBC|nr:hypothetical protein [Chitinilyticum litopenaei]